MLSGKSAVRSTFLPAILALAIFTPARCVLAEAAFDAGDHDSEGLIEEFFLVESAYPQERGEFQLTLSTNYVSDSSEGDGQLTQVGIEYGVTDRLQVEANLESWRNRESLDDGVREENSGFGELEFGLSYAFPNMGASGLRYLIGVEITAPVGDVDKELGEGFWVYEPFLIVSREFGEQTNVTLGLSYGFRDRYETPEEADDVEPETDELELSLGVVRAFGPQWRGTLELKYETDELHGSGSETEAFVAPGAVYSGMEDLQFGFGMAAGLTADSSDWMLLGFVVYEF